MTEVRHDTARIDSVTIDGRVALVARSICSEDCVHKAVLQRGTLGILILSLKCEDYGYTIATATGALPDGEVKVTSVRGPLAAGEAALELRLEDVDPEFLSLLAGEHICWRGRVEPGPPGRCCRGG